MAKRRSHSDSDSDMEMEPPVAGSNPAELEDAGIENTALHLAEEMEEESNSHPTRGLSGHSGAHNVNVEIELDQLEVAPLDEPRDEGRRVGSTEYGDAVVVRNAMKSYRSGHPVLNGFNMTVPCGSIYGLLGSSGCGKTTMLSCLVGLRQLDKGKIWIFGKKPGTKSIGVPGRNVGYMPQDISLYYEFSIEETLNYFGTLGGMMKGDIQNMRKFFVSLLDLPEDSRRVGTLSGGQQRRVSLVAALLSGPELLILDEPTVGVDPLIRQNIWTHLKKLVVSKRTTVIITTHYIEECRSADNIGIMRNGRLLEERPPDQLMLEHGSNNLERIVLNLSRRDTMFKSSQEQTTDDDTDAEVETEASVRYKVEAFGPAKITEIGTGEIIPSNMAHVMHESDLGLKDALVRIRALTGKNFVILYRNPLLLFFVVLIAAILVILICIALGPEPKHLSVGLVNHEADYFSECQNITRIPDECNVELLSCHYLSNLKKDALSFRVFDLEEDALTEVHSGASWGYIAFPKDFSASLYERIGSGSEPDVVTLNASQIIVKLDNSNKQISNSIKKALYDAYEDFISNMLTDCGYDPRQGESALQYRAPLFGEDTTDFREFLAPGAALVLLFFFPIITTSIRFIKEKKNGVLYRSIVGGVRTWEIMAAYSISEFCVLVFQSVINYAVISILFDIQIRGSHLLVMILFLLTGYGGVSMGFMLGSICSEEIEAAILAMAAFFPNIILSGILWPTEGMVMGLQYVVQVLPCTFAAEAVRSITSRGWEFTHPNVWPGFAILVGYIIGYFILTALFQVIFRR